MFFFWLNERTNTYTKTNEFRIGTFLNIKRIMKQINNLKLMRDFNLLESLAALV